MTRTFRVCSHHFVSWVVLISESLLPLISYSLHPNFPPASCQYEISLAHRPSHSLGCCCDPSPGLLQLWQFLLDWPCCDKHVHSGSNHHTHSASSPEPSHRKSGPMARHWHQVSVGCRWAPYSGPCYLHRRSGVGTRIQVSQLCSSHKRLNRSPCNFGPNDVNWCIVASEYDGMFCLSLPTY